MVVPTASHLPVAGAFHPPATPPVGTGHPTVIPRRAAAVAAHPTSAVLSSVGRPGAGHPTPEEDHQMEVPAEADPNRIRSPPSGATHPNHRRPEAGAGAGPDSPDQPYRWHLAGGPTD